MYKEPVIATCTFGWGKKFELYREYMDVDGARYVLTDLRSVQAIYREVLGVASARLILKFRQRTLVLRGIPVLEDFEKVIAALALRGFASEQSGFPKGWQRTRNADKPTQRMPPVAVGRAAVGGQRALAPFISEHKADELVCPVVNEGQAPTEQMEMPLLRGRSEIVAAPADGALTSFPLQRTHRFDEEKLARRLKEERLTALAVPLLLLSEEEAYYSTRASLCGERASGVTRTYPPLDHGLLILTNMRMLYLGRRRQIVLDYQALLHVSRLRGAIAFQADHWQQRAIFEIERPLECAMYLECILQRFQQVKALPNAAPPEMPDLAPQNVSSDMGTLVPGAYDWDVTEIRASMPHWLKQLGAVKENQAVSQDAG